jgi:hypothetical protein
VVDAVVLCSRFRIQGPGPGCNLHVYTFNGVLNRVLGNLFICLSGIQLSTIPVP